MRLGSGAASRADLARTEVVRYQVPRPVRHQSGSPQAGDASVSHQKHDLATSFRLPSDKVRRGRLPVTVGLDGPE